MITSDEKRNILLKEPISLGEDGLIQVLLYYSTYGYEEPIYNSANRDMNHEDCHLAIEFFKLLNEKIPKVTISYKARIYFSNGCPAVKFYDYKFYDQLSLELKDKIDEIINFLISDEATDIIKMCKFYR